MFFEGQFAHVCVGSPPVKYVYLQLAIATSIYVTLRAEVRGLRSPSSFLAWYSGDMTRFVCFHDFNTAFGRMYTK